MIEKVLYLSPALFKALRSKSRDVNGEPPSAQTSEELVSGVKTVSRSRTGWLAWGCFLAAVMVAQYLAVRLGLVLGISHGNVSPVWPATGIAIAFLLRFGINLWPGVALGSFLALAQTDVGPLAAGGEAAAAVLESLAAVWLVRRWISPEDPFAGVRDVVSFCFLAGGVATALSATIGVGSLFLGGLVPWKSFSYLWGTWWLGDMMGALIIAPFIIIWTTPGSLHLGRRAWTKTALILALLIFAGLIAFWGPFVSSTGAGDYPIAFLTLPLVVFATFLAGRSGATAACLICSTMAISGTIQGLGPFYRGSVNESLLLLQSYLVVVSVTALILAAVLKERDEALNRLWRHQEELEDRISQRTQELSAANDRLQKEVAERKKIEVALRQGEEMLSLALHGANLGIWDWDLTTGKALWTEQTLQILGYEPHEFEPDLRNWKRLVHPDDWPAVTDNLNLHMAAKLPMFEAEYRIRNKSGNWQWVQARGKVISVDEKGKPTRMTGVFADATEPKKAQDERRSLVNQLIQAQKMEAVGTLTGGIAHDFNNLLTVINGHAEMILLDKTEDDPIYEDLRRILNTGRKGAELVQRLLAFSQKADIKLEPLNVNDIVENSIGIMERTFPKMIRIDTVLGEDLGTVNADAVQVEQILMNLCINAKEAMPEGGRLTIKTENEDVKADYCRLHPGAVPGRYVLIEISDTGSGMSKEIGDRVFDPFFTTKGWGSTRGTGLGLSVAKGLAEQHGGWITCDSEPGKGTTFRLYFPIIGDIPSRQSTKRSTTAASGNKILLVDDEELVCTLGTRILERAGYEVMTSSNGRDALEIFKRDHADIGVVVLDLVVPHMEGEKCLEELLEIDRHLKVIVATGNPLSQEDRNRLGGRAKGFVDKPYRMKQLLEAVRGALAID